MGYTGRFGLRCKDEHHFTPELSIIQLLKVVPLHALGEGNL
jgi:hypothetical protein